jgi:uncharacterized protein with von Willebrand factor type A (vWA) domain
MSEMLKTIVNFANLCRAADMKISTSEVLDCIHHLELIDLGDETQFRTMLKTNFVKTQRDQEKFDGIYDLFFHTLRMGITDDPHHSLTDHLIDIVDVLRDDGDQTGASEALFDFLMGDSAAFLKELQNILSLELDVPEVPLSRIIPSNQKQEFMTSLKRIERQIDALLNNGHFDFGEQERRHLGDYLMERLGLAQQMIGDNPFAHTLPPKKGPCRSTNPDNLGELPFSRLTQKEIKDVHEAIERLTRKLKDMITRRYNRKNKGVVDIKKTLRRAARYEGIPMEITFRKRPPRKPKIVTLCDVSFSVWYAVPFMLNILYSLQDCFSQVKSFVFIANVVDVSDTFTDHEIVDAIDTILADFKLEPPQNAVYGDEKENDPVDNDPEISDYGETFAHFQRKYLDVLDKKTTLIIMGDGRSNYLNPKETLLDELRDRCRRIIWLNPEPEHLWDTGDSEIKTYRPYCHELRPGGNLNQLADFITELVL